MVAFKRSSADQGASPINQLTGALMTPYAGVPSVHVAARNFARFRAAQP